MSENRLTLTFEGPSIDVLGVPFEDLASTISHLQRAISMLVRESEGTDPSFGQSTQSVIERTKLRLVSASKGSATTEWELSHNASLDTPLDQSGARAVQALFRRNCGSGGATAEMSATVKAEIDEIGNRLSDDVDVVRITSPSNNQSVEIRRSEQSTSSKPDADGNNQTHSRAEPFDLEAVLNDPHPKVFRRDKVVTASEPFDVEEFNQIIRKGRRDT